MTTSTTVMVTTAIAVAACGGPPTPTRSDPVRPRITSVMDRILPLFPDGVQVLVELDLARIRANPVIGEVVTKALDDGALVRLPASVPLSPLAHADAVVLAAYGVGTAQAATVTVLVTKEPIPGAISVGDGLVAVGPEEWVAQLEARAAIAQTSAARAPLLASPELLALRDHAMPVGAPGASLRITARLPFDARISFARQTGLDAAPAQLSVWADVVDDVVVVVDADGADPGDRKTAQPAKRLEATMRAALVTLAADPSVRALGIPASLEQARFVPRGTWLRTIIAIGPAHLHRVVERATALLRGPS